VNPDDIRRWTREEAIAKDEQARSQGEVEPGREPLMQWAAVIDLDELERDFRAGKKRSLFTAIRVCATHGLILPNWVALGFIAGFDRVVTLKTKSWDDAFGLPFKKGVHINSLRIRRQKGLLIYRAVERLRAGGQQLDGKLFDKVGKDFGVCRTLANEMYYQWDRRIGAQRRPPKS
jgi:hypothetical protein